MNILNYIHNFKRTPLIFTKLFNPSFLHLNFTPQLLFSFKFYLFIFYLPISSFPFRTNSIPAYLFFKKKNKQQKKKIHKFIVTDLRNLSKKSMFIFLADTPLTSTVLKTHFWNPIAPFIIRTRISMLRRSSRCEQKSKKELSYNITFEERYQNKR